MKIEADQRFQPNGSLQAVENGRKHAISGMAAMKERDMEAKMGTIKRTIVIALTAITMLMVFASADSFSDNSPPSGRCLIIDPESWSLQAPCADVLGNCYSFTLNFNTEIFAWQLDHDSLTPCEPNDDGNEECVLINQENWNLEAGCSDYGGSCLSLVLNFDQSLGIGWRLDPDSLGPCEQDEPAESMEDVTQPFNVTLSLTWMDDEDKFNFALETGKDLNVQWSRTEFIWSFDDEEYLKGPFEDIQTLIDRAKARGINLYALMAGDDNKPAPSTEEEFEDYSDYVAKMVEKYGKDIKYWEIWNEVNAPDHWPPNANKPENYFELLKKTYIKVKNVDPTVKIIGFGGVDPRDKDYFETVFSHGGLEYMDLIAVHPYADTLPDNEDKRYLFETTGMLQEFDNLRTTMEKYGEVKPLWGTEMAISTGPDSVSEQRQAELIVRMNLVMHSKGVEQISWFHFWDEPHPYENNGGIVNYDRTRKKSYDSFKTMVYLFDGYDFVQELDVGEKNIALLYEKEGDSSIIAAWTYACNGEVEEGDNNICENGNTTRDIELDIIDDLNRVLDIYGNEVEKQSVVSGDKYKVSSSPLYYLGTIRQIYH